MFSGYMACSVSINSRGGRYVVVGRCDDEQDDGIVNTTRTFHFAPLLPHTRNDVMWHRNGSDKRCEHDDSDENNRHAVDDNKLKA